MRRAVKLALLLLAVVPGGALASWRSFNNQHFEIWTDSEPEKALELARELDRFRSVVDLVTNADVPANAPRTQVVIFRTKMELDRYSPGKRVQGYVIGSEPSERKLNPIIVMSSSLKWMDEGTVIRHEYVHVAQRYRPLSYPRWYDEGIAEVLASTKMTDTEATVGLPVVGRLPKITSVADADNRIWRSFDEIVSGEFEYHRELRRQDSYGQYWLLAHYLTFGAQDLRPRLKNYLIYVADGMDSLAAFDIAFGKKPQEMWATELFPYLTKGEIPTRTYTFRTSIEAGQFQQVALDEPRLENLLQVLRDYRIDVRAKARQKK